MAEIVLLKQHKHSIFIVALLVLYANIAKPTNAANLTN